MNERIRELAEQAGYIGRGSNHTAYMNFDHDKFAELIVRECVKVSQQSVIRGIDMAITEGVGLETTQQALPSYVERKIKEHFGVE